MINLFIQCLFILLVAFLLSAWIDHKTRHWAAILRVLLGASVGIFFGILIVFVVARQYFPAVF